MATVLIIIKVLLVLVSIALIALVMMQESKDDGLSSSIAGGMQSDSFMSKNAGRTKEGKLKKYTLICLALFFALTLALNILG